MNIALFSETYLPFVNGVVTHLKVLKEGLELLGHNVLIVTADPEAKTHFIENGILHCPSHSIKKLYGYGISSPISRKRLKLITSFNPDVIHVHNEFSMGLFGIQVAKRLEKPLVYTLHTVYNDYLYYVVPEPLVPVIRVFARAYARWFTNKASALTGPSKKVEEFFNECGIDRPVSCIPNSVEYDVFDPEKTSLEERNALRARMGIASDAFLAVFVGRIGKEKSIDVLLQYWKVAIQSVKKLHLLVVGDGPDAAEIKELANELGLHDHVSFSGKIPHEDIAPWYAACDVYVTASLSEMMSISMLEGMASGLPAIIRSDPLNDDQVQEGINGYHYQNAKEMTDILKQLAEKPAEEMRVLHEQVRRSVRDNGAKNHAAFMLDIYNSCVMEAKERAKKRSFFNRM